MKRIAILGTGAISDSHLQAYQKFNHRAEVVALVDLYADKAKEKAAKYGLEVPVFQGVAGLLAGCDFDAASVCLPPFEHASAATVLLRAGKHVLTEKPMATSLDECDAMLAAAEEGGALLGVVAQNRFKTPMMKLKRVLDSGFAGKVLHAQADSFWWRGGNYYDLWWRGTWAKEGGGCTLNHAVHHIDLFQWMMGGLPAEVRSVSLNLAHRNSEVEDFSTSVLTYPDGRVGQITASLVHHGEEQQLVFQGERAKVAVPWMVTASNQKENGFPEENPVLQAEIRRFYEGLPAVEHEGHAGQIENFLSAIERREPLLVDGEQGRRTLELVTAIYQAGHRDEVVKLPLAPDSPFYSRAGILQHARHFHEKTKSVANFANDEITLGRDVGR
ncbi:MAG: Gfo/Idh/MocA family oxidoreductase [Verrucomicrobiales bacterium]|nr:Gfo/Idh/MocA family oxidoreductase [Verrucomicrobiales bacterium]